MNLLILLGIFTAFLALAFPLLHLLASLSELRKGKNTLGNQLLFIGSCLATVSLILYFFLPCCFIPLDDWLWFDLLRSLLEWETQRKLPSSSSCHSSGHRSGDYNFISSHIRKAQVFSMKT